MKILNSRQIKNVREMAENKLPNRDVFDYLVRCAFPEFDDMSAEEKELCYKSFVYGFRANTDIVDSILIKHEEEMR